MERPRLSLGVASNPIFSDVYNQAQGVSQQPMQYYPGQTVAGFTPAQTAAQEATINRATQGSPLMGQAQGQLSKTIQGGGFGQEYNNPLVSGEQAATVSGAFLNPESNPWLNATYNQAAGQTVRKFGEATMPEIRRAAIGEGAYGGGRQGVAEGIAGRGLAEELGNIGTSLYGQNYQTERSRQETAAQTQQQLLNDQYQAERARQEAATMNAIPMAQADYADIGKLAAVGEEQQTMDQALIDQAAKAWEFYQTEPWNRLGMYSNLITGDVGGTTMSTGGGK